MGNYVLIADDHEAIKAVVEKAIQDFDVKTVLASDVATAKRKLVLAIPCLIVTSVSFSGDPVAGHKLCKDLQAHSEFSKIPVVVICEKINEQEIAEAKAIGAKALFSKQVTAAELKKAIGTLLPSIFGAETVAATNTAAAVAPEITQPADDSEEKIAIAQRLLAKVLHNLKTSDLLLVVDKEDVPRVVYEMTKTVCGMESSGDPRASKRGDTDQVDIDLDNAFGLKPKR